METKLLGWASLALVLTVSLLGIGNILTILGAVISLLFCCLYGLLHNSAFSSSVQLTRFKQTKFSLLTTSGSVGEDGRVFRIDRRLTGSSVIDDTLQEVLHYLLRDYIESWYKDFSHDAEFLHEARVALQEIVVNFSIRCKEVDWLPFLTARLVDIIASHLRLYHQARLKWRERRRNEVLDHKDLENIFFELELALEKGTFCRKTISTDAKRQKDVARVISELCLFLTGPAAEFRCRPVQLLLTELVVHAVFLPVVGHLTDPDFLNQVVIWLCKDFPCTSETFLTVLRCTENVGELEATRDLLNREIAFLRSRDLGGEDDLAIKQQLSSLLYVKKIIDHRLSKLQEGTDTDSAASAQLDWSRLMTTQGTRLYQLPLDVILKDSLALSYFLDFMTSIGAQSYLFFLLNADGWKISAEQQIASMQLEGFSVEKAFKMKNGQKLTSEVQNSFAQILSDMREAASSIYDQYLSEKAPARLRVDDNMLRRLLFNIRNEPPCETWFEEVQTAVVDKLQKDERFLPSFRKSVGYLRLLAELDLLKDLSKSDDEENRSLEDFAVVDAAGLTCSESEMNENVSQANPAVPVRNSECTITASISQKGVVKDGLSSHAVYAVAVTKFHRSREIDSWLVYRRYSDFLDLHHKLSQKYKAVQSVAFPSKRTFNNMDKLFLERRQFLLNEYLQKLLDHDFLAANPGLQGEILYFLDRGSYEQTKGGISRKVDSLFNPLVSSVRTVSKAVRWVPDNLFNFTRSGDRDSGADLLKGFSGVDLEGEDNVPLRILLLLIDEVFDLRNRNQWLRKRIFYVLREILRAMYGDVYNKKIVDLVANFTSPEQVADYIRAFKNSFWPGGIRAMPRPPRDEATKMRTRVAAKMALLACLSDELKHLIGSETSRQGVLRVFELLQHPVLNRRLLLVLLEQLLETLFPSHNIGQVFQKLYAEQP